MLLRAALAVALCTAAAARGQTTVYVGPAGDDSHAGTTAAPLATLAGARDRVRGLDRTQPIVVEFAAGTYRFAEPTRFDRRDSGRADAPITYRAAKGAEVRFTGGVEVTGWEPVTDSAVLDRLPTEARRRVRVATLEAGIDPGKLPVYGFGEGAVAEPELFFNDRPMTLARWPNTGFRGIAQTLDSQRVVADSDRVARWADESDPWVFAYWHHNWAELYEPLVGVDADRHALIRSPDITPRYGITAKTARWYGLNLLCEIDSPGEYYIDRDRRLIYFWPPAAAGKAVLSQATGIIEAADVSHVTFRGIVFEAVRGNAVQATGGSNVAIVGCTLRNVGQRAVVMNGGTRHTVYGCDISQCGGGGVLLVGGDRATLTPAGHNVENNHVHDFSRRHRTYHGAIETRGVGNRITHNLVHHGPHLALRASGNDHIVEFNEVHNVVQESGDAGALYGGRDWTQRGTRIQYNYWHDIKGALGHGGMVIYQDDQLSGQIIHGNVFDHVSRAVFLGGGCDHVVTNNVFLNCWRAVHLDNRGMNWQKKMATDPNDTLHKRLHAMPYQNALWRKRYPTLADILADDPGVPKRNRIESNVSAGGTWDDVNKSIAGHQAIRRNLVYDGQPSRLTLVKDDDGKLIDITFADAKAVRRIGFERIPVEKIGLYEDPRRATWPVGRRVEPVSLARLQIENKE